MTDIDVPDWVVEDACKNAWPQFRSGMETEIWEFADAARRDRLREITIAALRAALSAWVVPKHQCMCTDEDEVPNGPRDIWMDVSADDYPKLTARNDVRGRTLYELRQEKPE